MRMTKTMRLDKRATSVRLEPEFWAQLEAIAAVEKMSLSGLVDRIKKNHPESINLASTLRVWCLERLKNGK